MEEFPKAEEEREADPVGISVMGQTVVAMGMVSVTRTVEPPGQLVTSGPQLVTVLMEVVKIVDVVRLSGGRDPGVVVGAGGVVGALDERTELPMINPDVVVKPSDSEAVCWAEEELGMT